MTAAKVASSIVGSFRWLPPEQGGRLFPPDRSHLAAIVRLADPEAAGDEHCLVIDGIAADRDSEVRARWQDPEHALAVGPGDVLTVVGGNRPIATLEVTSVT